MLSLDSGNDVKKQYLKDNIISTNEACEYLNISRQTLYNYVNQGKLTPLKQQSGSSSIYYFPDVCSLKNKLYDDNIQSVNDIPHKVFKECDFGNVFTVLKREIPDISSVVSIKLYGNSENAVADGYFYIKCHSSPNLPTYAYGPHCVITLNNGKEKWFDSKDFGANRIPSAKLILLLKELGIEDTLINVLFKFDIVEYYQENKQWKYRVEELQPLHSLHINTAAYFLFKNSLILFFGIAYDLFFLSDIEPDYLINSLRCFVPNPESIRFLPRDYALSSGRYIMSYKGESIARMILRDESGREVWFPQIHSDISLVENRGNISDIFYEWGLSSMIKQCKKEENRNWLALSTDVITITENQ